MTATFIVLAIPGLVRAQTGVGGPQLPSGLGPMLGPPGPLAGTGNASQANGDVALSITDSFVSFIDSAVPRTNVGLRFDGAYHDLQPMRATYLFARGGLPNSSGFPLPETRVDTMELTSFAEYSLTPWLSFFMEAPYRWINPEINPNTSGAGDMRYGLKICTWSDQDIIATFLLRIYQPTARQATLGTGHWSLEPGLLAAYRINDKFRLEGEFRYWTPLSSDDFAGNILRYGVGLAYGQRNPYGLWFAPVVEGIGWSILSGKSMIAASADEFIIEDARNQTIINAYLGVRIGYGANIDGYIGYGRALTGVYWARDMYRVEFRFSF